MTGPEDTMTVHSPCTPAADFEPYRSDVYRWAFRLLGQHHDAADVTQDVFLRWFRQVRSAPPSHPRAWLRRTTINRSIDALRSRRPAATLSDMVPAAASPCDDDTPEVRTTLALALDALTDQQRHVLLAKVFDGLTFARIATEMGLAVPTVKTHYLRAIRSLRDTLIPLHDWPDRQPGDMR